MSVLPEYERPRKRLSLVGIFFILLFASSWSNASPSRLSDYFQEVWTTRDGLPHNTVNAIQQSEDGYLWVGTWEGAARFNGRDFTVFGRGEPTGMPDVGIRTIYQNQQQDLIFAGARGGLTKRHLNNWQDWSPFNVLINAVVQDQQDNLWLATEGQGLYRQTPGGERTQFTAADGLPSNVVSSVLSDSAGTLWIGTGRGLVKLNQQVDGVDFSLLPGLPDAPVMALYEYNNTLLIGTENGLYQYRSGAVSVVAPELLNLPVSALLAFDNQVWIGTTDRGLLRLSEHGLEKLNRAAGLPNNRILSLFRDRENSIWVGSNGGLFRLRDAPFVTLTTEQGLAGNYIRAVLAHSDGSIWVGSSQGISNITGRNITAIDISSHSNGQSVLSLVEDRSGSVWIGTYSDGLLQWRDNRVVQQHSRATGLLANEVRAIAVEPNGGIWVGTAHGLNYIDDKGVKRYTTEHGLPTPFVMALYLHDDGRLFVGTGGGVVIRQPDGRFEPVTISHLDNAEYAFGFAPDPPAGLLWMSTDRGLVVYDLSDDSLTMLGRDAGLPFDKVFQAVLDRDNHLWLSSNRGIMRFQRGQLNAYLNGERKRVDFELFGESDGMQSSQANGGSMQSATLASDGTVWFATSKGVSRVNPAELARFSANTPPVVVEGFKADGSAKRLTGEHKLPAGTGRVEIQFAGLGFVMPERIQYRTRLIGFDSDWVGRGSNIIAEYTNLPPGNYRFMVSASYPGGEWGEENGKFEFSIAPYFWQQSGFWFAVFLTVIALILLVHRWRLKHLRERAKELSEQVTKKTSELKQQADYLRAVDEERSELLRKIKLQATEFEQQARSDKLTGLANRRAFDEALSRECARARRTGAPLCLALLDIDHFKRINDQYSHSVGDNVLKLVAQESSRHCREEDLLARWGGEEFALLLPNCDEAAARTICERIRHAIEQTRYLSEHSDISLTISIGITVYQPEEFSEQLINRTDKALYAAKQTGRNQVTAL